MSVPQVLLILLLIWLAIIAVAWLIVIPRLRRGPAGNAISGFVWWVDRIFVRIWHRARFYNTDVLPTRAQAADGLIVVSNHTCSLDPLLIQAPFPVLIRWLMATETMLPALDWLWEIIDIIPVDRDGKDAAALREAIRHVRGGGCLGIFPEGRLVNPPRELRPFLPGIGVIIARSKAPVLLAWVTGTPETTDMIDALAQRSHSRVTFLEVINFDQGMSAEEITATLRAKIHDASGWPYNDEMLPKGGE